MGFTKESELSWLWDERGKFDMFEPCTTSRAYHDKTKPYKTFRIKY